MSRAELAVIAIQSPDGSWDLACPGTGTVRFLRLDGEVLVAGSRVGVLVRDERSYTLVVPPGVRGSVRSVSVSQIWNECGHGDRLAVLGPAADAGAETSEAERDTAGGAAWLEVRAPTHGTFYCRPSPGSPPYVEVGAPVVAGDTLGLIEVMKCFSPILFAAPPGGTRGLLREVLVGDGVEVRAEELLMRIEVG